MQTVTWNPQRELWETEQADLFSGRQEPFSETWPTSGMTRSGRLLPLPASAHPIDANESLLLPTPVAQQSGNPPEVHLRKKPGRSQVTDLAIVVENGLLQTGGKLADAATEESTMTGSPTLTGLTMVDAADADANRSGLLPTPRATDGTKGGPNQRGSSGDLMLPSAVMNLG